jgi:hypothetical protein
MEVRHCLYSKSADSATLVHRLRQPPYDFAPCRCNLPLPNKLQTNRAPSAVKRPTAVQGAVHSSGC